MDFKAVILILVLLVSGKICQAKNILYLMGIGTESTEKWNKVLLKELANNGHDLTIVTASSSWSDNNENDVPNADIIYLETTQRFLRQRYEKLTNVEMLQQNTWKYIIHWYDRQMATCRANLESVGFSEVLHLAVKEKRKYDAIVYDLTYGPGCLLHLAYLFGEAPIIGVSSGQLNADILSMRRETIMRSSLDPYVLSDLSRDMNYWRRLQNTALYAFDYCYRKWVVEPVIQGIWSKNMQSKNVFTSKSLNDLWPRFKLILANYHPSLHSLQTLPVNVIPVPGLHIQPYEKELLTLEYLKFVGETKRQVILIDLNMKSIGSDITQKILEVVKTFPENGFIWLKGDAKVVGKQMPQNLLISNEGDIGQYLALDKVRCSILTADFLNILESLHHGVPIIAIATKPEERYIAQRLIEGNLGIAMELTIFTSQQLETNINRCLKDSTLKNNIKKVQPSLRSQQNPPLQTAVWWIEHILENPQANDYLVTQHRESLSYFAENSFDVILIFQLMLVLCIVNTIIVVRQMAQSCRKTAKSRKSESKSQIVKKTKKSKAKTS